MLASLLSFLFSLAAATGITTTTFATATLTTTTFLAATTLTTATLLAATTLTTTTTMATPSDSPTAFGKPAPIIIYHFNTTRFDDDGLRKCRRCCGDRANGHRAKECTLRLIASFGAIVLTFLAGTDIDPHVVKRNFASSVSIGLMGFFAPYVGCLLLARYGLGWPWPEAQIAGIALSTTSVAVVYAVMVETGYNRTELGKIILAACFINDIGTVLALGLVFANYNVYLVSFAVATIVVMAGLPRVVPWLFARIGGQSK